MDKLAERLICPNKRQVRPPFAFTYRFIPWFWFVNGYWQGFPIRHGVLVSYSGTETHLVCMESGLNWLPIILFLTFTKFLQCRSDFLSIYEIVDMTTLHIMYHQALCIFFPVSEYILQNLEKILMKKKSKIFNCVYFQIKNVTIANGHGFLKHREDNNLSHKIFFYLQLLY